MDFDTLGDYCKWLEKNFSPDIMIPTLPVIIRLDGNNFSKWTKSLTKPFDENLTTLMVETTKYLVKETNAVVGYTQSDEITLILYSDNRKSAIYNDGKKQKILSKLTSKCSNFFNSQRPKYLPNHNRLADFDCRIYQTPSLADACGQLVWRENDAVRNSVSMLGQSLYSPNVLLGLKMEQLQDKMMVEKGVNWNDLDAKFKRGTYVKRIQQFENLTLTDLEALPEQHNARKNPQTPIVRNKICVMDYPIFTKISNRVEVIFFNETPKSYEE